MSDDESFQPLDPNLLAEELILQKQRQDVTSICDSYHLRFDSFAEAIQNAMDALEMRWSGKERFDKKQSDGHPYLRVLLDFENDYVAICDNGIGMSSERLKNSLTPHISLGKEKGIGNRGHKGVGTTYLTYGHNQFEVHSKASSSTTKAYRLEGGLDWRTSDVSDLQPPPFDPIDPTNELDVFDSGTLVRFKLGPRSSYSGHLSRTQYNSFAFWEMTLRTYTAIGHITLPRSKTRPEWLSALDVELVLTNAGSSINDSNKIEPEFFYPDNCLNSHQEVSLDTLLTRPPSANKYLLVHLSWDKNDIKRFLAKPLADLRDSGIDEKTELYQHINSELDQFDISIYASLANTNTLYQEIWATQIGSKDAIREMNRQFGGGTLVGSAGMPMGSRLDHLQLSHTILPQIGKRFFLLVHFDDKYRPDIGRKTIPQKHVELIDWIVKEVSKALRTASQTHLKVGSGEAVHGAADFRAAQQQLSELIDNIKTENRKSSSKIELKDLSLPRRPNRESEVVAQFNSLIVREYLKGYVILAWLDSSTRYDALFDVILSKPQEDLQYGIDPVHFKTRAGKDKKFRRNNMVLEFKLKLRDLIANIQLDEGEQSKKYFEQIHLAVCDDVSGDFGEYELVAFNAGTEDQRNCPGSTHQLKKDGMNHVVEVVYLPDLIQGLKSEKERK